MKKDLTVTVAKRLGEEMGNLYDQILINTLTHANQLDEMVFGKITGYKTVKAPRYLTIKIPDISKQYDDDSEYGTGEFEGFLISFKEIKLFRIGTKTEKQPIRKKPKGQTVSFSRYNHDKTTK